jgi:hypothetical protein
VLDPLGARTSGLERVGEVLGLTCHFAIFATPPKMNPLLMSPRTRPLVARDELRPTDRVQSGPRAQQASGSRPRSAIGRTT